MGHVALPDEETCYRAVSSRDARFDGWFFSAVLSTGIFCRPSCPAVTPKRANLQYYATAAAAINASFRACLRCRPDAVPGSPEWNLRTDIAARAVRLIRDGVNSVADLAARLGYSERHLNRLLSEELGAGPLALIRTRRAQTARVLIETTKIPFGEVAFAAGFESIRQFNDTVLSVFARTPTQLRQKTRSSGSDHGGSSADREKDRNVIVPRNHEENGLSARGVLALRLPYRKPADILSVLEFLSERAITGVEEGGSGLYRRVARLPHGLGTIELSHNTASDSFVDCHIRSPDMRDLPVLVAQVRRLLDLDADPAAIASTLGAEARDMRIPGALDPVEIAVRAIIGQQVSVAGARTIAGRFAEKYGETLPEPEGNLVRAFPTADALAAANPEHWPMPATRRQTIQRLCESLANGEITLDGGSDVSEIVAKLQELPGIGPWTASYVAMRGLSAPDVFMEGDLGVRKGAQALGLPTTPKMLATYAERWSPYRSYANMMLWQHSSVD